MKLSKAQRFVLFFGMVALFGMLAYPPWTSGRYTFLFDGLAGGRGPSGHVDVGRLLIQCVLVALATALLVWTTPRVQRVVTFLWRLLVGPRFNWVQWLWLCAGGLVALGMSLYPPWRLDLYLPSSEMRRASLDTGLASGGETGRALESNHARERETQGVSKPVAKTGLSIEDILSMPDEPAPTTPKPKASLRDELESYRAPREAGPTRGQGSWLCARQAYCWRFARPTKVVIGGLEWDVVYAALDKERLGVQLGCTLAATLLLVVLSRTRRSAREKRRLRASIRAGGQDSTAEDVRA